jgi:anti-sigma factor RsiW
MTCEQIALLIQAELDNELDTAGAVSLSDHISRCAACAALRQDMAALSARLRAELPRYAAPDSLRRAIPAPPKQRRFRGTAAALPFGAGFALAACLALLLLPRGATDLASEAVAGHIRALQPGHLADIASSDKHTVKPWFDGKLDYAPPVRDFARQGFPLIGGRLDYLAGRPVAALVYGRGKHLIDLFVWPAAPTRAAAQAGPRAGTRQGYNFRRWTADGMEFWAVSDVSPEQLEAFAGLWRAAGTTPSAGKS